MTFFGWYKSIETTPDPEQIKTQLKWLEVRNIALLFIGGAILIYGVLKLHQADSYDAVSAADGLFFMICGVLALAVNNIVTRNSLNTYKILIALSKHQK